MANVESSRLTYPTKHKDFQSETAWFRIPRLSLFIGALLVSGGCGTDTGPFNEPSEPAGQCETTCSHNGECAVRQVCGDDGCCQLPERPTSDCPAGEICFSFEDECALSTDGCACDILGPGGETVLGEPIFTLSQGGQRALVATLYLKGSHGRTLHEVPVSYRWEEGSAPGAFEINDDHEVLAGSAPGQSRLLASFGDAATCSAQFVNPGPAPQGLRISVTEQGSGAPVTGASVVVDATHDGLDDGATVATDAQGQTLANVGDTGWVDVTVFADGYEYLTVTGVPGAMGDIVLPLRRRALAKVGGAASGRVDFESYREVVNDGVPGSVSMAMVATSFPFGDLARFDLATLMGGPINVVDCSLPEAQGCYPLKIPGIINQEISAWGGMILSLPTSEFKPHFDVAGALNRRRVWSLGGEWNAVELESLIREVLLTQSPATCECDSDDGCQSDCACDFDCQGSTEGRFFRRLIPLLGHAAFGVSPAIDLQEVELNAWRDWQRLPYDERVYESTQALFDDQLSEASMSAISLDAPLTAFNKVTVPALPVDAATGEPMEAMLVLTGRQAPGVGFVPTGLGIGFDCTADVCPGRNMADSAHESYDGHVDGSSFCKDGLSCEGAEATVMEQNQIAVAHNVELAEVLGGKGHTVLLAMPLDSFDAKTQRVSAVVIDGEMDASGTDLAWAGKEFIVAGEAPVQNAAGLKFFSQTQVDLQEVVIESEQGQWRVLSLLGNETFTRPAVPEGLIDPWSGTRNWTSYRLIDVDGPALLAPQGQSLDDLAEHIEAFSSYRDL